MDRKKLFKTLTFLVVSIFLVNLIAVKLYWYSSIWYFDMFMHFAGGLWLGLAAIWLLFTENFYIRFVFKVMFGVLLIGILWEVFEILVNNAIAQNPFNILDIVSDIFFDLAGGVTAVLYFLKSIMSNSVNKVE